MTPHEKGELFRQLEKKMQNLQEPRIYTDHLIRLIKGIDQEYEEKQGFFFETGIFYLESDFADAGEFLLNLLQVCVRLAEEKIDGNTGLELVRNVMLNKRYKHLLYRMTSDGKTLPCLIELYRLCIDEDDDEEDREMDNTDNFIFFDEEGEGGY